MTPPAFLHPFAPPAATSYLSIVRGERSTVWDDQGRPYLDAMASLWYCNVGHGRQEVADAIAAQAATLAGYHCFAPFTNPPADVLSARIAAVAPVDDPRVALTCSGSESVDTAIKLARMAHERAGQPERDMIVSRSSGYHGVTYGGTSAQGIPPNREGFGPLVPGFVQVPHHDLAALEAVFAEHGPRIAAVITEPLQAAGGVFPAQPGYLAAVRALCDAHGAFLIADEVVCGFGRLGTWFGSEHLGLRPDMITFAKAVTSGYVPLGGVVVGKAVREPLEADATFLLRHGHTYSGHPLACAAALACLDLTESEDLMAAVPRIGGRLEAGLRALQHRGLLREVRGDGAVWGAVVPDGVQAAKVRDRLLTLGVIVRPINDVLAVCPPLVMTDAEVDQVLDAMGTALAEA
ncbi:MAG: aspartate aminotransferase family protein [Alphaproteobacteria bacterium]|nr:aspartate aminotransferase family protein [Alphaproteobacteria bacterium]